MVSVEERNELALAHADLVDKEVRRGPDPWFVDDLRQEAFIGLLDAASRFDPERGEFRQYARRRIRGAIRDWCRRFPHPDSRRLCRKGWLLTETDVTVHKTLPMSDIDDPIKMSVFDGESEGMTPYEYAASRDEVRNMLACLGPRSRTIILGGVIEGIDYTEIAAELGVCKSRVSQLLRRAMDMLRRRAVAA
jgi:RNA polymerase sigma factor for flagellar operon FliA